MSLSRQLRELAETNPANVTSCLSSLYSSNAEWCGSHPLNEIIGRDQIAEIVWSPILSSFPDLERRDLIFVGGRYEGRDYIACVGHYCGTDRKSVV